MVVRAGRFLQGNIFAGAYMVVKPWSHPPRWGLHSPLHLEICKKHIFVFPKSLQPYVLEEKRQTTCDSYDLNTNKNQSNLGSKPSLLLLSYIISCSQQLIREKPVDQEESWGRLEREKTTFQGKTTKQPCPFKQHVFVVTKCLRLLLKHSNDVFIPQDSAEQQEPAKWVPGRHQHISLACKASIWSLKHLLIRWYNWLQKLIHFVLVV